MSTLNTVSLIVICILAASAVVALGIGCLLAAGRSAQGGPPPGSLARDDDDLQNGTPQ